MVATSDVLPLIEQIDGVWSTKRDYTRFLAMIVALSKQKQREIPLVKDLFSAMAASGNVEPVVGLIAGLIELCSKKVEEAHVLLQSLMYQDQVLQLKDLFEAHYVDL
jgi:hypothetical protein